MPADSIHVPDEGLRRHFAHFVHAMQYYFRTVSDSHDLERGITLIGVNPSPFVTEFIAGIKNSQKFPNVKFTDYPVNRIPAEVPQTMREAGWQAWFAGPAAARRVRDAFIATTPPRPVATIGIINRTMFNARKTRRPECELGNRRLLNARALRLQIGRRTGIVVDEMTFDDKSFSEQIRYCNDHDIIISPHGAQMCSIPFVPDYGVVIEINNPEYCNGVVRRFFRTLALSSGKGHLQYCETHDPETLAKAWDSMPDNGARRAVDITVDVDRVTDAIVDALRDRDAKIRDGKMDDLLDQKI